MGQRSLAKSTPKTATTLSPPPSHPKTKASDENSLRTPFTLQKFHLQLLVVTLSGHIPIGENDISYVHMERASNCSVVYNMPPIEQPSEVKAEYVKYDNDKKFADYLQLWW